MNRLEFTRTASDPQRLDTFLTEKITDLTRSHIQNLISGGAVTVGGLNVLKNGFKLSEGSTIAVEIPEPETTVIEAEDIPLDIAYEDSDVIVVNKPKDMVVHPSNGHYSNTLVNALMHHCKDLSGINGELRPGIVHRIDKDTTGLIIACKNDRAHNSIAEQLAEHSIERRYVALVYGNITEAEGTVDAPLDRSRSDRKKYAVTVPPYGKNAVTHYKVLKRFRLPNKPGCVLTLVECRLETGRTHQIRVHMSHIGHPLAGDETYGISKDVFAGNGQYLHAKVLGFTHPVTGERLRFEAELPEYFTDTLARLTEY